MPSENREKRDYQRRLHVEQLEDRQMMSATSLVADINRVPSPIGYPPQAFTDVNGVGFFREYDDAHGYELWKTDGTAAGTLLVKDIRPGASGASPDYLTNVGGTLYFSANDGTNGIELWKSDGTEAGTVRIKDALPWPTRPTNLTNVNGTLFFCGFDNTGGYELWSSDGTAAGTVRVKDIRPGAAGGLQIPGFSPQFTNVGGTLYFRANDGTSGFELWKSDGTQAGTVRVKDIYAGSFGSLNFDQGSQPYFTNVNGTLFFRANDSASGIELWKSDGSAEGTVRVKDIRPGIASSLFFQQNVKPSFVDVDGTLFFSANDGLGGVELWKSDGTEVGTVRVRDIYSGSTGSFPTSLVNLAGALYFTAGDSSSGGELWKSDGTAAGTLLVKDILTGALSSAPHLTTNVGGVLYFWTYTTARSLQLWKSDGTTAGTVAFNGPQSYYTLDERMRTPVVVGDELYFWNNSGPGTMDLWKSDNSSGGAAFVKQFESATLWSLPNHFANVNGTLYFRANDGTSGFELWKSDGTPEGSMRVKDIWNGHESGLDYLYDANPFFTNVNGTLYFVADNGTLGKELWKSDGTEAGTVLVKDVHPGVTLLNSIGIHGLMNVGGTLFFTANDGSTGYELWTSDGTDGGTVRARDILPGPDSLSIRDVTPIGGVLYFVADDGSTGYELWRSDGTEEGTVLVKDILPGLNSSRLRDLTNLEGVLYFTARDESTGYELWKSDGTDSGTVRVKDIWVGSDSSSPSQFTIVNGTVFFQANDGVTGYELWKSDGTESGTLMVKDIDPHWFTIGELTNVNGTLYFSARNNNHGTELWKSDGTEAGTQMVRDIVPGTQSSEPGSLVNLNGILYFSANDATARKSLWKSDGTAAGTTLVPDIANEVIPTNPKELMELAGNLFFQAYDVVHGTELWKIAALPALIAGDYDRNGSVDNNDYNFWKSQFNSTSGIGLQADGNGNGVVDASDYNVWRDNFGATAPAAGGGAAAIAAEGLVAIGLAPPAEIDPPSAVFAERNQTWPLRIGTPLQTQRTGAVVSGDAKATESLLLLRATIRPRVATTDFASSAAGRDDGTQPDTFTIDAVFEQTGPCAQSLGVAQHRLSKLPGRSP